MSVRQLVFRYVDYSEPHYLGSDGQLNSWDRLAGQTTQLWQVCYSGSRVWQICYSDYRVVGKSGLLCQSVS